jgi:hypothetical protein
MALLEKAVEGLAEGGAVTGAAVGLGVLLLAPGVLPIIGRALRPLAVGAIKTGMSVYNQTTATVREVTEDLVAEARAELEAEGHPPHAEPTRRRSRAEATS